MRAAWSILNCARRTSTFLSCAFREQEDDQAALIPILRRPRVARAQKIIRLHPLLCSASKRTTRLPFLTFFSSLLGREPGCLPIDHPDAGQDQRDAQDFTHAHWFFQQHRREDDGGHRSQIAKDGSTRGPNALHAK